MSSNAYLCSCMRDIPVKHPVARAKFEPQLKLSIILPSDVTFCMTYGVGLSSKSPDPSWP